MLIDTYAWIELFQESEEGMEVKKVISEQNNYTSIVSISEIVVWALKNNIDPEKYIDFVRELSGILEVTDAISILAGRLNFEIRKNIGDFGMIDSIIYATAKFYNLQVLTGDKHFQGLDGVIML